MGDQQAGDELGCGGPDSAGGGNGLGGELVTCSQGHIVQQEHRDVVTQMWRGAGTHMVVMKCQVKGTGARMCHVSIQQRVDHWFDVVLLGCRDQMT